MGYNIKKQSQTYLPIPNNVELNFTGKDGYIERLLLEEVRDKDVYGIDSDMLLNWIYHNFNSVFVLGKELSLEDYKKLIK
jgi:hypothetical protein